MERELVLNILKETEMTGDDVFKKYLKKVNTTLGKNGIDDFRIAARKKRGERHNFEIFFRDEYEKEMGTFELKNEISTGELFVNLNPHYYVERRVNQIDGVYEYIEDVLAFAFAIAMKYGEYLSKEHFAGLDYMGLESGLKIDEDTEKAQEFIKNAFPDLNVYYKNEASSTLSGKQNKFYGNAIIFHEETINMLSERERKAELIANLSECDFDNKYVIKTVKLPQVLNYGFKPKLLTRITKDGKLHFDFVYNTEEDVFYYSLKNSFQEVRTEVIDSNVFTDKEKIIEFVEKTFEDNKLLNILSDLDYKAIFKEVIDKMDMKIDRLREIFNDLEVLTEVKKEKLADEIKRNGIKGNNKFVDLENVRLEVRKDGITEIFNSLAFRYEIFEKPYLIYVTYAKGDKIKNAIVYNKAFEFNRKNIAVASKEALCACYDFN